MLVFALACSGLAPLPVRAQTGDCADAMRSCLRECTVAAYPVHAARATCLAGCRQQYQSCRVARPEGAAAPAQQRGPQGVSPVPTLAAPMSPSEIAQALAAAQAILERRADGTRAARQTPLPPECQVGQRGYNPMACTMARERTLASQPDERSELPRLLLPLQASLRLELDALPGAPLERITALQGLRQKYQGAADFLRDLRQAPRLQTPGGNALHTLAQRFEEPRLLALRQAQLAPEVKQAWLDGRVASEDLALDFLQRIEWDADRQTRTLLQALRAELPGVRLFAERDTDLDASARERSQTAAFASWGQPSEHEIGLALLRVYAANNGRLKSAYEAERTLPMSVGAALAKAPLVDVQRVLHVQKARPCTRSGPSWNCTVRLWLHVFQRGDALRLAEMAPQNPVMAIMAGSNAQVIQENGSATELRLRATEEGFQAYDLIQRLRERDEQALARMDERARRSQCEQRRLARDRWLFLDADCKGYH